MVSDGRALDVNIIADLPGGPKVWSLQVMSMDTSIIRGTLKFEGTEMPEYSGAKQVRLQEKHVRLFLKQGFVDSIPFQDTVAIPMHWFDKMDYYDYDKKEAQTSTVIVLGVVVLTVVFLAIAASSALSGGLYSCPYIHNNSPDGPIFQGEIYADAITPASESHDWMPLQNFQPENGAYRLSVTNPTPEEFQHTNLLELVTVDHPEGSEVLFDKYGAIHSLNRIQMPRSAVDVDGVDYQYLVAEEDSLRYLCGLEQQNPQAENTLVLEFKRPHGAQMAKLVVNAKNTAWLDYTFERYRQTFGENNAHESLKAMNREALGLWMSSQNIPLSVWLETAPGVWKYIDAFPYTGPAALRPRRFDHSARRHHVGRRTCQTANRTHVLGNRPRGYGLHARFGNPEHTNPERHVGYGSKGPGPRCGTELRRQPVLRPNHNRRFGAPGFQRTHAAQSGFAARRFPARQRLL